MNFKKKISQGPKLKRDIFARTSVIFKPLFYLLCFDFKTGERWRNGKVVT